MAPPVATDYPPYEPVRRTPVYKALQLGNHVLSWFGRRVLGAAPLPPPTLPVPVPCPPPTPLPALDAALDELAAAKGAWAQKTSAEKAALLRACLASTLAVSAAATHTAAQAKGTYESGLGEERSQWFVALAALRGYAAALDAGGAPGGAAITRRPGGQLVAAVFPRGPDEILYAGFRGEIWLSPNAASPSQGRFYRETKAGKTAQGGVEVIMGAGNQVSVVFCDVLHALVASGRVALLKMNPINAWAGPYIEAALAPLVAVGALRVVYGGAAEGAHLCKHRLTNHIHITGSCATHDAIVWVGTPKAAGVTPPLATPVTSELGGVSPVIVVPGDWSQDDLAYHAMTVASALVHNASHNCLAAKVVLTARDWPLRPAFLTALRAAIAGLGMRAAYYPGSAQKHAAFWAAYPSAEPLGVPVPSGTPSMTQAGTRSMTESMTTESPVLPWLLATGVPADKSQRAFSTEAWVGFLAEAPLDCGPGAAAFLAAAVDAANGAAAGTLACCVIVDPATAERESVALDAAIAGLRYGSVVVNGPAILGFAIPELTWGGFPGATPDDIQSGVGTVHNVMLFDSPQKSVLFVPWRVRPRPMWDPMHANLDGLITAACEFKATPGPLRFGRLLLAALRSG